MSRSYWPLVLVLAAVWGASFLFIKVAVEGGLEPAPLMSIRTGIAAVILFAFLARSLGLHDAMSQLAGSWPAWVAIGVVGSALPFWLVAWGETHVDSGIAAIAQSTVPIFTILLGLRFLPHEPMGALRWLGIGAGAAGVVVLAGGGSAEGWWSVAGTLAVVLSALAYGCGNVIGQRSVAHISGPVLATGSMFAGCLALVPLALLERPHQLPDGDAIAALLALTIVGTAFAQLVMYRVIRLFGSRRMSLVTYLLPGFALVYGALFLDERLTITAVFGLALILGGVALGSRSEQERARVPASVASADDLL